MIHLLANKRVVAPKDYQSPSAHNIVNVNKWSERDAQGSEPYGGASSSSDDDLSLY
jgi:hypothetical protein